MTRRAALPRRVARTQRSMRRLPAFMAMAAAVLFSLQHGSAWSAPQPELPTRQASSGTAKATLPKITIEAKRRLKQQVDRFVTSVVVRPVWRESLVRWNVPVCPLVQGLPGSFDAFIRTRITQIARSADVPLAGRHCSANFYVFVTDRPELLLKELWAHNPRMFEHGREPGGVERFLHSRHPVRVWYNTALRCRESNAAAARRRQRRAMQGRPREQSVASIPKNPFFSSYRPPGSVSMRRIADEELPAPRLRYKPSRYECSSIHLPISSMSSVIVVGDLKRMKRVSTRAFADYVAMIGLADVRLNHNAGATPTILRLFRRPRRPPRGLSRWDRALLHSLYSTRQSSATQVEEIEAAIVRRFTGTRSAADTSSRPGKSASPLWTDQALPQRDAPAIYWSRIGADQGNATAQDDLGVMYAEGHGVPRSYAKAARWFRKAAEQGNADAQSSLGVAYANGQGVPRSYAKAARWFRKAADEGNAAAQFFQGVMYAKGQGLPQDYVKAAQWFRKAAVQRDAAAQYALGVMYADGRGVRQSYEEAAQWYRKAAKQGNANAQSSLGLAYATGRGVAQDYAKTAHWFRKAAEQGDADAQFDLGLMYARGQGVPLDYVRAYRWWLLAVADSRPHNDIHDLSRQKMRESASEMTAAQIALAHRQASRWLAAH